jgi:ABC-type transport system substrate-binding protein
MVSNKNSLRLLLMVLSLIFFAALPNFGLRSSQEIPRNGGTLRIRAFENTFKPNLDPAVGRWIFITDQIFDGLVRLDYNLDIVPSLAEYWKSSEDGGKYTFYLRKGVKFHHGQELSSDDVKFSLERLIRKETNSPYAELLTSRVVGADEYREGKTDDVSGFKVLADDIFEIQWKNPHLSALYPLYLLSMSFCSILPKDLVTAQGNNFFWKPMGTGAFKFESWIRSPKLEIVGARLERNNDYFGKKAYLDFLEFSPFFTVDNFMDRELDIIPFLSNRLAASGCQVVEGSPFNITYLMLSCRIPPLDRLPVRKALAFGIDKEKLAKVISENEIIRRPTDNYIPSRLPGFFPLDEAQDYDLDKAWRILEEQGFSPERKFPELTLFLPSPRNDVHLKFAAELQNQLRPLGISLDVRYYRTLDEIKDFKRPFLAKLTWRMDFPDAENIIRGLFSSSSTVNKICLGYENSNLEGLLAASDMERSRIRRIEIFRKIEKILRVDLPSIPLFSEEERMAVQPYVRGVKVPALGFQYMDAKDIWLVKKEQNP